MTGSRYLELPELYNEMATQEERIYVTSSNSPLDRPGILLPLTMLVFSLQVAC